MLNGNLTEIGSYTVYKSNYNHEHGAFFLKCCVDWAQYTFFSGMYVKQVSTQDNKQYPSRTGLVRPFSQHDEAGAYEENGGQGRSEEHTSELQSQSNLVC